MSNKDKILSTDKALRNWRPLVKAEVKVRCLASYNQRPVLAQIGMTPETTAALCIAKYYDQFAGEIADSLKPLIPEEVMPPQSTTRSAKEKANKQVSDKAAASEKVANSTKVKTKTDVTPPVGEEPTDKLKEDEVPPQIQE